MMSIETEQQIDIDIAEMAAADRIGFARLTKLAFDGVDLRPLRHTLLQQVTDGTAEAGAGLDLSLIAQLLGEKQAGLSIQSEVLAFHGLFRSPCRAQSPKLRVLALAAATDMGSNTPIEFLLEESDIELTTLYVVPQTDLRKLPEHDVAIVIASDSEECREALARIDRHVQRWPRPMLNAPRCILNLDRDKLHRLLDGVAGIDMPATICVTRAQLGEAARPADLLIDAVSHQLRSVIVRPRGSHAGVGLAKVDDAVAMSRYLEGRPEQEFFISRFVDYSSGDGQFRKYRIVVVDGRPYACHMAIAGRWDIWYLNAEMSASESKRAEEANFMRTFEAGFALRHAAALTKLIERVGLDYFIFDCAENKDGKLLIFEADNTAVVHNMDSVEMFPYKPAQMKLIFEAVVAMLYRHAQRNRICAA